MKLKLFTLILMIGATSCFKQEVNQLNESPSPLLRQHSGSAIWWKRWEDDSLRYISSSQKVLVFLTKLSDQRTNKFLSVLNEEQNTQHINKNFVSFFVDLDSKPQIADYFYAQLPRKEAGEAQLMIFDEKMQLLAVKNDSNDLNQFIRTNHKTMDVSKATANWGNDDKAQLINYFHKIKKEFDTQAGVFPEMNLLGHHQTLSTLLKIYNRHDKAVHGKEILGIVNKSLLTLYASEHYDHIQGGFFNRVEDRKNLVNPSIEKDLMTNIAMAKLYLETFQLTDQELYKEITLEILNYIVQNLRQSRGAFYTSSYMNGSQTNFGLLPEELLKKLTPSEQKKMLEVYDIKHFLSVKDKGAIYLTFREDIKFIRQKINRYLQKQKANNIDDRVILAYNAEAIKLFTKAYQVFRDKKYISLAFDIIQAMKKELFTKSGTFRYVTKAGNEVMELQDYVSLVDAYIALYETELDERWLQEAISWQNKTSDKSNYLTVAQLPQLKIDYTLYTDTLWLQSWIQNLLNQMKLYALTNSDKDKTQYEQSLIQLKKTLNAKKLFSYTAYLQLADFKLDFPKQLFVKVSSKEKSFLDFVHQHVIPSLVINRFQSAFKNRPNLPAVTEEKAQMAIVCQIDNCSAPLLFLKDLRKLLQEKSTLELE
ncbi:MAG: thioredoxin domain-containing protein [Bacteriovoracaceae bacterium]|nr:thioredoxin domain-containing protein [Bacteriovoracaceae bacterium]